jgi:tetratricopeptide (TPR) repeat protein
MRGQVSRADREELAEAELQHQAGRTGAELRAGVDLAYSQIMLRGKPEAGERVLDSLVASFPRSGLDAADLPLLSVSDGYVRAGAVAKAERVFAEYELMVPEQLRKSDTQRPYSQGLIALGKGQYAAALAGFREARIKNGGVITALTEIAQAFEGLHQTDSALAAYEGFADQPEIGPAFRQYMMANTLRRLGELYEARSNKDKALDYYGRFTALWKNADPDLLPQVQEVKKRMAALVGEPRKP